MAPRSRLDLDLVYRYFVQEGWPPSPHGPRVVPARAARLAEPGLVARVLAASLLRHRNSAANAHDAYRW